VDFVACFNSAENFHYSVFPSNKNHPRTFADGVGPCASRRHGAIGTPHAEGDSPIQPPEFKHGLRQELVVSFRSGGRSWFFGFLESSKGLRPL
jgi:hypothetical protein